MCNENVEKDTIYNVHLAGQKEPVLVTTIGNVYENIWECYYNCEVIKVCACDLKPFHKEK